MNTKEKLKKQREKQKETLEEAKKQEIFFLKKKGRQEIHTEISAKNLKKKTKRDGEKKKKEILNTDQERLTQ